MMQQLTTLLVLIIFGWSILANFNVLKKHKLVLLFAGSFVFLVLFYSTLPLTDWDVALLQTVLLLLAGLSLLCYGLSLVSSGVNSK
jgi:hypothetical protein